MKVIFKTYLKILMFCLLWFNCSNQAQSIIIKRGQQQTFDILGKWKLIKRISLDERIPLSLKESSECLNYITIFSYDSIVSPKDSCFNGFICLSPNYKIQKVSTYNYYEGDTSYLKLLGIAQDSIQIITSDCGVPFTSIVVLNENNICYGMNGYEYFLTRVPVSKERILYNTEPSVGDTVRCKYIEKSGVCTGYIIQGTRKSGKVIHVTPKNKNVPMEVEEEKLPPLPQGENH